jgi:hypothetical protein
MYSSSVHVQVNYKLGLELRLQTFVILYIHPHKNPII